MSKRARVEDDKEADAPVQAITLTFGECMENHVGMQKVGEKALKGYTLEDLNRVREYFFKNGHDASIVELKLEGVESGYVLVVRNAFDNVNSTGPSLADLLLHEHRGLTYDKKYYDTRRGKVLNKRARWNLCFDDEGQDADYENKKGTIVPFKHVPWTSILRRFICNKVLQDPSLKLEANYYQDPDENGIGFHGDTERSKVLGVRLGKSHVLAFKQFLHGKQVGEKTEIMLHHGDLYMMSEKAAGPDWKKKNIPTLRHAAGGKKYTK